MVYVTKSVMFYGVDTPRRQAFARKTNRKNKPLCLERGIIPKTYEQGG